MQILEELDIGLILWEIERESPLMEAETVSCNVFSFPREADGINRHCDYCVLC